LKDVESVAEIPTLKTVNLMAGS
jgi:hypothetical protein